MRHNSNFNNLTNNNNNSANDNSHGGPSAAARYCSVGNAYNVCNNVAINQIGTSWSHKSRPSKASPSKEHTGKQVCRTSYQNTANSIPESGRYSNTFLRVHGREIAQTTAASTAGAGSGSSSNYNHKQLQSPEAEHSSYPQYKMRQYAAHPEPSMFAQTSHMEEDRTKRQARARPRLHLNSSPTFAYHSSPSPEPTWDSILSERPSHSTDQHYEHYFSYFYNRGPEKLTKFTSNTSSNRKLPMNCLKNTSSQRKSEPRTGDISSTLASRRDVSSDSNRNLQYDYHVLKEKLPNNNLSHAVAYTEREWADGDYHESALLKVNKEYLDIKDVYDNEEIIEAELDSRVPLPSQCRRRNDAGDASSVNNNNESVKLLKPKEHQAALPRLPLTPKRVKGGAAPKKLLPTVHRVLLYNSQSPRMPRKQQPTSFRSQSTKQPTAKVHSANGSTIILVESNAKLSNRSPIDFDDREDDFDEDDDLDNISNFDESDTVSASSDSEDGYRAHAYKLTHSMDRFNASQQSTPSVLSSQSSEDDLKNPESLLVPSLFPYVPPYLSFSSNTKKGPKVPAELHRVLKWRITNIMPKVVRLILANSGMRMLKKTNDWMGVWGKHLKSPCFKTIRSYQKINHLPGSFRIGRKDSCWKNLQRQMNKHSNREFGFMPRTYIIPNDLCALRKHWPRYAQRNTKWIIKPPASARGAGIRVINRWGQIPKRRPLIVQKYIERPLLINGSKFDLRLYVLVTSVNPLRVFMYHNGLARFASVKYSAKVDTLNDRCMHLTNYSINKFSSNYSKNEDVNACHGHKWTIKSLWTYLANRGVRTDCLWEALRALVLRTILAGENGINSMIRANVESKYSCFELFGFDVILDSDLVPWLLEVNISPSLHSELPLDAHVKAPLVQGVLNTALYNVPPKLTLEKQKELAAEYSFPPGTQLCYDKRLYINYLSREEKVKHNTFTRKSMDQREEYIDAILEKLTPDDVRCLIVAEDELARCAPLERIFPTDQTHKYLKYNDTPRYYNRLLDAWESRYANNRTEGIALLRDHCQTKYHLQVPAPPAKKTPTLRSRTLVLTRPHPRHQWAHNLKLSTQARKRCAHMDEEGLSDVSIAQEIIENGDDNTNIEDI